MELLGFVLLVLSSCTVHSAGVIEAINGTNLFVDHGEDVVLQWKVPNKHNDLDLKTWELARDEKTIATGHNDKATISKAVNDQYENRLNVTKSGEIVTVKILVVVGEDAGTYALFGSYDRNVGQESASTTVKVKEPPTATPLNPTVSLSPRERRKKSKSLDLAAIIGIVIGAVVVFAIVIVLYMCHVRKKKKREGNVKSSHLMKNVEE